MLVENTFGLITTRFRILHHPINLNPEKAKYVVLAICVLHNFLKQRSFIHTKYNIIQQ